MSGSIPKSRHDRLATTALARFPQLHRHLKQRFVVLPEPYSQIAWLVDLHDPFHPTAQRHESWAAAEAARRQAIRQALIDSLAERPERTV